MIKKPIRKVNLRRLVKAYKRQRKYVDREPAAIYLRRFGNDRSLTGSEMSKCCDCGLRHLFVYQILVGPENDWWLFSRAYRIPDKKNRK